MNHDPLCPWRQAEESDGPERWLAGTAVCECDLIAKVRKDENRKVNHLRRRIERLVEKADRWRDEAADLRKRSGPLCADHAEDQYETECMKCDLLAYMQKRRAEAAEWGFKQGERDMLAKCIAAVEFLHDHNPDQASAFWYAINELRALQQPTGPIADLTDEEADAYYEALQEKP